jgi:ribosome-binding protein aMBF1 (putative translation factor)
MAETRDFGDIIRDELAADPKLAEEVAIEQFNADLAMKVYEARVAAGLTQKQLASRVGTQQSVISRIESADYYGRSLTLLSKIAKALGLELRVEFVDTNGSEPIRETPISVRNLVYHGSMYVGQNLQPLPSELVAE